MDKHKEGVPSNTHEGTKFLWWQKDRHTWNRNLTGVFGLVSWPGLGVGVSTTLTFLGGDTSIYKMFAALFFAVGVYVIGCLLQPKPENKDLEEIFLFHLLLGAWAANLVTAVALFGHLLITYLK
jgi:hypothetical protein